MSPLNPQGADFSPFLLLEPGRSQVPPCVSFRHGRFVTFYGRMNSRNGKSEQKKSMEDIFPFLELHQFLTFVLPVITIIVIIIWVYLRVNGV
ncbi:hypothetical protein CEXT_641461 [Caerostris extrusa]|uniref:Uncharacterized protein n=1 Tax=Caerostris extrusa TaxID=172846 RepID=A0AAV4SNC2_CAEEX|nr:hypothetical protein CEXT_641461 [Caerostris extrusa]